MTRSTTNKLPRTALARGVVRVRRACLPDWSSRSPRSRAWLPSALAAHRRAARRCPPAVSATSAATSAELEGTVYPHGLATTYFFQYGPPPPTVDDAPGGPRRPPPRGSRSDRSPAGCSPATTTGSSPSTPPPTGSPRVGKDRVFDSKSRKLKFSLPKSLEPIPYRQAFTLNGKVSGIGNAGVGVVLQETPYPFLGNSGPSARP